MIVIFSSSISKSARSMTKRIRINPLYTGLVTLLYQPCAWASTLGSNAWETILSDISKSFTGPVAYSISIIAIVLCGLSMAFADMQGGVKRFIQASAGISITFFAAQIVTGFLHFNGAVI